MRHANGHGHQRYRPGSNARLRANDKPVIDWDDRIEEYQANGTWHRRWLGPPPGHAGCRVPPEIAAEYGYRTLAEVPEDGSGRLPEALDASTARPLQTADGKQLGRGNGGRWLISQRASDGEPEKIDWVWSGRIARGKHTTIAGDPGTGKSQVMLSIAAAATTGGAWPCSEGRAPLGNVVILAAEDGVADTIIPRLIAAGADLDRVDRV
jgi:hypothetical protein